MRTRLLLQLAALRVAMVPLLLLLLQLLAEPLEITLGVPQAPGSGEWTVSLKWAYRAAWGWEWGGQRAGPGAGFTGCTVLGPGGAQGPWVRGSAVNRIDPAWLLVL